MPGFPRSIAICTGASRFQSSAPDSSITRFVDGCAMTRTSSPSSAGFPRQ
jgi:hypothetical protein